MYLFYQVVFGRKETRLSCSKGCAQIWSSFSLVLELLHLPCHSSLLDLTVSTLINGLNVINYSKEFYVQSNATCVCLSHSHVEETRLGKVLTLTYHSCIACCHLTIHCLHGRLMMMVECISSGLRHHLT